ncbi:hypothetical protein [Alkaliphilus hydrothermalis]|uniref:rRNA maturation endonuclease Nob1 n=1 Tax=Alkaliphilus hydrothermalis TaxID=1482730 RepID=A0ABS2NT01_9FIRM|nr:hypothetical protein [Alkaliphilus hydrothermalis]MBM7616094.1 rRNA maturation endonuclease Nob1 [Alkaliphilus hydrothermalis]
MEKFFCPICGNQLIEEFAIGDICSCCGNESCVDDDILSNELAKFNDEDFLIAGCNKSELKKLTRMPFEVAHRLLRAKWINDGCKWVFNSRNEKPNDWSLEKAKQQLSNINEDIDNYINGIINY